VANNSNGKDAQRPGYVDQRRFTSIVRAVDGDYILCEIDSDIGNIHALLFSLVLMTVRNFIMARQCRLAGSAAATGPGSSFHSLAAVS
jgi:hypothetical protein